VIRAMRREDVPAVVVLHVRSFPSFFLTFLGPGFLTLLYEGFLEGGDGVALVDESDGAIRGVVAGTLSQKGFYTRLLARRRWAFAAAALRALAERPGIAPRLFRALRRPEEAGQASADACLMSLAVDPSRERRGLGQALVRAFCAELASRGAAAVCLTTDRDGNAGVNRFYARLGFQVSRIFVTPEGRALNEYLLRFGHGSGQG
jgi:ribosomal protein S18 acetylase RimI-like enzyme